MKKIISLCTCVVLINAMPVSANLVALEQDEMTKAIGQGAAELSWTLSLNHQYANNLDLANISTIENGQVTEAFYDYQCLDSRLCRIAIAANNHKDSQDNQKWLVFKQIQGTLQIDKFTLEGTTIINQFDKPQTALKITFEDENPLKIRNLGFASLAVETGATNSQEGFTNYKTYSTFTVKDAANEDKVLNVPSFDKGQEQGFMGLNVHGNLHMNGSLKIFSYNCAGASAGGRC